MKKIYFESSAVLAWLVEEPGFEQIETSVNAATMIVTSVLTLMEIRRSLVSLDLRGLIKEGTRQKVSRLFEQVNSSWNVIEITSEIQIRAGQPFPVEPVRTLDAIHLATMLETLKIYPDLSVITLDKRVRDNLEPLGLTMAP